MTEIVDTIHGTAIRAAFALWYGRSPYGRHAGQLDQTQWWPWNAIHSLQMRKLRALTRHAYQNVPFYRHRFDEAGLHPGDIRTPDDLAQLPILTKRDIQDHLNELLAQDVDHSWVIENHTGGSTGHPLTFYQDVNYRAWEAADMLRSYRMAGYELGMRWAFLWGSDYDARAHKGLLGRLKDRVIYNMLWIDTFDLGLDSLTQASRQLVCFQPRMLVAYVSSATLLARLVDKQCIEGIKPCSIQTSAEVLTPDDRQLLETTFGCSVFDRYGCREVGNIAHECDAHQGLHILAENNWVEFLDAHGQAVDPGEPGRVVVTNLNNHAMPFIRYDTGDVAVASRRLCSCGRGLPLIDVVVGRRSDIICSPSGKLLHGEFFTHLFYKLSRVHQFRIVQETGSDLRVQIVPTTGFDQRVALGFLEETIHRHGDPAFRIQFEICQHIPASPSGKYRFIVSKVSTPL